MQVPKLNRRWHQEHRMPKNATAEQRIAWHVQHAQVCGCRPIPKGVLELMRTKNNAGA
jgi:hypothetical protein